MASKKHTVIEAHCFHYYTPLLCFSLEVLSVPCHHCSSVHSSPPSHTELDAMGLGAKKIGSLPYSFSALLSLWIPIHPSELSWVLRIHLPSSFLLEVVKLQCLDSQSWNSWLAPARYPIFHCVTSGSPRVLPSQGATAEVTEGGLASCRAFSSVPRAGTLVLWQCILLFIHIYFFPESNLIYPFQI